MIQGIISKLRQGKDLSHDETDHIMTEMLSGRTTDDENSDLLSGLAAKGETDDELLGMLEKMQEYSLKIGIRGGGTVIDMGGTGGDGLGTFNISTAASFVVAAAGGTVAKHGNRSSSGVSGSADIFEYFGYDLNQEPAGIPGILEEYGICFMFAQKFHPAMRHVSGARKRLKTRTVFNLLGPLSNPAGVKNQLVGVSSAEYLQRLPQILRRRGAQNVMTVRSDDGMDEFSTGAINRICVLDRDGIRTGAVDPEKVGLHRSSLREIRTDTRDGAVRAFVGALNGTANRAMIETTALNAAAGLIVAGVSNSFEEAVKTGMDAIMDGRAYSLLEKFIRGTGDVSKLKEINDGR